MILFLHNRYRTTGGEERAVEDLRWLVREHLGQDEQLLERDSASLGARRAATGLLRGGLDADDVFDAVQRTGARIVHAHNLLPAFGWRALEAARHAGARTVLHLHNYRLVCAVGVCFTQGEECTRCHGRNTWPGVKRNCRGTGPENVVYATSLALHQRRLLKHADAVIVPSAFARDRLLSMGVPLPSSTHVVPHVVRSIAASAPSLPADGPALVVSRLAPEKGVDLAIDACRSAGLPLVVAGDGPLAEQLRAHAAGADVTFVGRVSSSELARLRSAAGVALVPSRSSETFGLAAAEAMAAGLPVAATRKGALADLVPDDQLAPPEDPAALGELALRLRGDRSAGERSLARVREVAAPVIVAPLLATVYPAGHQKSP